MRKIIDLSPNYSKKRRIKNKILFVIIHYTGMQSEIESLKRLKNSKSKVSSHYLINRKGDVIQLVEDNKIAWHAGKSRWKKYKNLNDISIGIELVNKGHEFGYEKFSSLQVKSLIKLCNNLKKKYGIKNENFLGHSDIAPLRKKDPGEYFPWKKLSTYKIGSWYNNIKGKGFNSILDKIDRNLFFQNIRKVGYRYFKLDKKSNSDRLVIKAFQMKYLPKNVTGKLDKKTLKISYFLANR